jgi:hypothetical protein
MSAMVNLSASPGGSLALSIGGNGVDTKLVASPVMKDFGSVAITTTSSAELITIRNTGTQMTGALTTLITGMHPTDFQVESDTCTGNTIAAGAACTLALKFDPTDFGARSAIFRASANGTSTSVSLAGNAIAEGPAFLVASPTSLAFADQVVGTSSLPKMFTLTNYGGLDTGPITFSIGGLSSGSFSTSSDCTSLAPEASCTVMVTFTPAGAGNNQAGVSAMAATTTVGVGVQGNGI